MTIRRLFVSLLIATSLMGPATAAVSPDVRAAVEKLLSGYEPGDPAPALRRLGPQAAEALLAIAADPAVSPIRRLRAIEALGHVPTPAGLAFLRKLIKEQQASQESLAVYQVAAAARALGGFGQETVADAVPLLDHPGADVREGAAAALAQVRTPEAMGALTRRLRIERDPGVRAHLQAAVRPAKRR